MDRSQWKNIAEDLITIYKKLDNMTTVVCDIEPKETPTEIVNKPELYPQLVSKVPDLVLPIEDGKIR